MRYRLDALPDGRFAVWFFIGRITLDETPDFAIYSVKTANDDGSTTLWFIDDADYTLMQRQLSECGVDYAAADMELNDCQAWQGAMIDEPGDAELMLAGVYDPQLNAAQRMALLTGDLSALAELVLLTLEG